MIRDTTGWNLGGTKDFRLSSNKLLKRKLKEDLIAILPGNWGGNRQNVNDELRRLRVPDPGKIFCQTDQAGAEALIVSRLTLPGNYKKLFDLGIKIHVFVEMHFAFEALYKQIPVVSDLIKLPIDLLPKHPEWKAFVKCAKKLQLQYDASKMGCHSSNYDIHEKALALKIVLKSRGKIRLPIHEVKRFLDLYRNKLFPEIPALNRVTQQTVKSTRTLVNLFGFPRTFFGALTDELFRDAYAFVPQSTVGCITEIASVEMQQYIEEHNLDWDFLNNCHDSMLHQCPIDEATECCRIQRQFINKDLVSPRGEKFQMKSESSIGYNWGKWHETENPNGLKELTII